VVLHGLYCNICAASALAFSNCHALHLAEMPVERVNAGKQQLAMGVK
jgi:hypothetical protein